MDVYLMRHGPAGSAASDDERRLTGDGREEVRRIADEMAVRAGEGGGLRRALVLSSPLVRARETAEIVGGRFGLPVAVEPGLASGATPEAIVSLLEGMRDRECVVLVGHNPEMGALAWWLSSGNRSRAMPMAPGTVVYLTVKELQSGPRAEMHWLLSPEDVR